MKPAENQHVSAALVDKAVALWRAGSLVAMPTETVYGLAADATNGEAVARIYALKSRPQLNPLIVHVADAAMAVQYVDMNPQAQALAKAFWPGPLTLVMRKSRESSVERRVSDLVSAGGDTLAIRVPAHLIARQLLTAFAGPIAAPSANRSGRVSPTTAQHVRDEFGDAVPMVVDGGPCAVGLESTVVDATGDHAVILRPGSITAAMIEAVLGRPCADATAPDASHAAIRSPGQLSSHYAPQISLRMNATQVAANEALLAFGSAPLSGAATTLNLSPHGDLIEAAANLFSHMRALDDPRYSAIAVMPIPGDGIGAAINDRLQRASYSGMTAS